MKKCLNSITIPVIVLLMLLVQLVPAGKVFSQNAIKFGNSYVNITKKTVGGTVEPGDILEIRTNYYFPSAYNGGNIYYIRYVDNVPVKTTYVSDSIRLITNEGLTYKRFTNAAADDQGSYVASPAAGQYNIRINIGTGSAIPANNGTATGNSGSYNITSQRPRVGSGTLLTTAFRVQVSGSYGDTVILGAGRLYYKKTNTAVATDTIVNAIQYKILISRNDPVCPNSVGKNFVSEAAGTFDSGFTQNRGYGPSFLIPNYTYRNLTYANQIGDGFYTIVNNLSPSSSTFTGAEKRPNCTTPYTGPPPPAPPVAVCANRMFNGHWEIMGDHTGAATSAGKAPAAVGSRGGYMLVVNADYATSEAYRQSIKGLCPNTSYEFSLWVKNVCTNCGIDSTGTQRWNVGVYPNLTFAIDDLDRYSSGEVDVTGWNKKGFLFRTGPGQDSITISIRNNASGGGGNDWAIDDIALTTCNPDLDLQPGGNANVCYGNQVNMSCLVRSYFPNYTYWAWEKSTNNGVTWVSTGQTGNTTPSLVSGEYEYTTTYPTIIGDSTSHLNLYRIKVATSTTNLSDENCSFATSTIIRVFVNDCHWLLGTDIIDITGQLKNNYSQLQWTTVNETRAVKYTVQKSYDQMNFEDLATFDAIGNGQGSTYRFNDPTALNGPAFYRIKMSESSNFKFSKTILLSPNNLDFEIKGLLNPFNDVLVFDIISPSEGSANILLIDNYGKIVKSQQQPVIKGIIPVKIFNTGGIASGVYTLRVQLKDRIINKRMVKALK